MTAILLSLLFIVSAIHAMTADDLKFCEFLAKEVFTPGKYKTNQNLMYSKNENLSSDIASYIATNNPVTFNQFKLQNDNSTCYIRGQMQVDESHWSTVLAIDFKEKRDSSKELRIIGLEDESDYSNSGFLKYFSEVDWVTIARDVTLRNTFEFFWTDDKFEAFDKDFILKEAKKQFNGIIPTKSMMECAAEKLKNMFDVSILTQKREEKKNAIPTNVGNESIKTGNGTANNDHEDKRKDGDQPKKPENETANKDHEDKSKDENDENEEKTIFANPYITWSIIFVLSIGWFFFFKYIRDRCLEEDDDIEYDSEFSYMEEDEGEEWPDV